MSKSEILQYDPIVHIPYAMEDLTMHSATGELFFQKPPNPDLSHPCLYIERTLAEMEKVLCNKVILTDGTLNPNRVIQRLYRMLSDKEEFAKFGIKYDITVMTAGDWGNQLPTTKGHYHLPVLNSGSTIPSPDFYQVLAGDVMAILQKETADGTEIRLLRPKPGEWVLIPGDYAHSVVNTGTQPAAFANACVRTQHLDYDPILNKRGMGVYITRSRINGDFDIVRNINYNRTIA